MIRQKVFFPSELIVQLKNLVDSEGYTALKPIFTAVDDRGSDHLELAEVDARNLLRLADIEMSKALLRFPHNEEGDSHYDLEHDEQYNDVVMGIYEKTYYYVRTHFGEIDA